MCSVTLRGSGELKALTIDVGPGFASQRYRRDALALQAGHQIDFFTGHSRMLRDWGQDRKYHHVIKGLNYRMDGVQGAVLDIGWLYVIFGALK